MSRTTHSFCRTELTLVMQEVRAHFTTAEIHRAFVWEGARKDFAFHGPNGEYIFGLRSADCKYSAAAEGWSRILEKGAVPCH